MITIIRKLFRRSKDEIRKSLRIPFILIDYAVAPFGYELLKKHFYSPIPLDQDRDSKFLKTASSLPGIDIDVDKTLAMARDDFRPYLSEFRERFQINRFSSERSFWQKIRSRLSSDNTTNTQTFFLLNGGYMAVDAHIYWSMIRKYKPRRIIEIGAGNSTLLAGQACALNELESGLKTELIAVEPYPGEIIKNGLPGLTRLIKEKVQVVDPSLWAQLESGDILFIDSSHVLASGNDVHYEYQEILPRLNPGVFVHIHDISLPKAYPQSYFDLKLYWNEQYLLQALLSHSYKFEVVWPGNYLMTKEPDKMMSLFPEIAEMRKIYPQSEPTAFWIRSKV